MTSKVAVVGKGKVGGALARGLERAGYTVRAVGNDPAAPARGRSNPAGT